MLCVKADSVEAHEQDLSPFDLNGQLSVSVNRRLRRRHKRLLGNAGVTLVYRGDSKNAMAVPVTFDLKHREISEAYPRGVSARRIREAYPRGSRFRVVRGSSPCDFVRLDDVP